MEHNNNKMDECYNVHKSVYTTYYNKEHFFVYFITMATLNEGLFYKGYCLYIVQHIIVMIVSMQTVNI